ncbi:hypothetical protein B9J07_28275 [Sinorhizobium sp. LM21]|uniref:phage tail fiber protein n=1 Tax=Sinorhizobium sp. LM21 TaxID=1449788 RepID=UPI0005D9E9D1|nr:hypothetical protein [Sinorhizobium sp. LM21]AJW30263.1 hypothetical protein pLM21S1_p145 [Sinorhizobium sp. LM21]OWZ90485.1 hypothetical protein B9J07_28275 [Sinorhizobium sp. LM21]
MSEVVINLADDITVRQLQSDGEAVFNYSNDIVVKARSGQEVSVQLTEQGPQGPSGEKGDTGDVTPELNQAKLDAQAAAADALVSKGIALAASGTATTKATEAATSATNANASKVAAATSETNANTSKNAAAVSAAAALTSENNAETAETNANASKNAAATSEANALAYRNTASTHATTATTKAGEAAASATAAAGSATAASGSAADALASKNAAAASATAAQGYSDTALTHANTAETAKTAAEAEKIAAQTAKAGAETAKAGAETALSAAEMAKTGSEAAQAAAVLAQTGSEAARDAAALAETGAETAKTGAETAKTASEAARDLAASWAAAAAASAEEAGQFDPTNYVIKSDNGADFTDPASVRANINAQVALATVDQVEAEAGTATTERNWTAQRVRQAIEALAPTKSHTHAVSDINGLQEALDTALTTKAPLDSPALTGTPTVPTAAPGDRSTKIANTSYVRTALDQLVNAAPGTLDTLKEIATALGNDPNFASTITQQLAGKANSVHGHAISDITGLQNALNNLALPARLGASAMEVSDWDWTFNPGFYCSSGALNEPPGGGGWWGVVSNRDYLSYVTQDLFQTLASAANTKHYRRHCIDAVWQGWYRVLDSQQELDARYAALAHTHTIANISGLQAALDAKADTSALALKAALASPTFTGTPAAPTATAGTSTTQLATTEFVATAVANGVAGKANTSHSHAISDISGLQAALDAKASLAGAVFTGSVAVRNASNLGFPQMVAGSTTRPGYIEFRKPDGTRAGYVGWGDGAATLDINAEAGYNYVFNTTPTVNGNAVWHAGNDGPLSGMSADLLDDLHASQFMRSDTSAGNTNVYLSSGQGNGLRFWGGDAGYSVYMSSQADATYGGRLDSASDYNMYFRMSNGAGRGFVFKNGTTSIAQVDGYGQFYSISSNNYRIISGNFGQFWRFDGTNLYLLFTASGDQTGGYNSLRPFYASATTGKVTMGHGLAVTGDVDASGNLYAGASGRLAGDGNVYGTLWGGTGDWLSNYLANQFAGKVSVGGRAYPMRIGGVDLNMNWSGQSGQPPWLWGGSDGSNMYVYNPSNFSVNYANSAGNADTVDGVHGLPGGDALGCYVWAKRINNTDAVAFGQNVAGSNLSPGGGTSTNTGTLSGTYQCRGSIAAGANTTGAFALFLKIG